jgi:chromosome partition protein MukF
MEPTTIGDPGFDESAAEYAAAARIIRENRKFELVPRDLALVVMLRTRLAKRNGAVAVLAESEIRGVYRSVDDLANAGPPGGFELRYAAVLERLTVSGCLVRSDIHRIGTDDPEYVLTGIGESVAEWNSSRGELSAESLMSILEAFNAQLSVVAERSRRADFEEDWKHIERQIRWVLSSLLKDVQEHQTLLDVAFADITELIPELLERPSEDSIEKCEDVLDQVVRTIADLYRVVHQAANTAYGLIAHIESNAKASKECPSSVIAHAGHVAVQIAEITEWTMLRQKSWVEHHAFVHQFVRNVIRVDRERRITDALKRGLPVEPWWSLSVSDMPKAFALGEVPSPVDNRRVRRRSSQPFVIEVVEAPAEDLRTRLDRKLMGSLAQGEARLSHLLRYEANQGTSLIDLARAAPWIMGRMVEEGRPNIAFKEWQEVCGHAEVQELIVGKK